MVGRANQTSQRAYNVRREGRDGGKIVYNGGQKWGLLKTIVGQRPEFGVRKQEKFSGLKSSEWSFISKAAQSFKKAYCLRK